MSKINYDQLLNELVFGTSNMMIFGKAGSGKSYLIRQLCKLRNDILITTPTGIAAMNIDGVTIDSLFGIKPYKNETRTNEENMSRIKIANILLIDEISMVKFSTINKIDEILKTLGVLFLFYFDYDEPM